MPPFFAMHDFVNHGRADTKLLTQGYLTHIAKRIKDSNLANVFFCQLGVIAVFAALWISCATARLSAFVDFIGGIVGVRSKEKMIGPNANLIVAAMADEQAAGNRTKVEFPGKAMRLNLSPLNKEPSVPISVFALENPAIRSLLDALPEPLLRCSHSSGIGASAAAKACPAGSTMDRPWIIFRAAIETVNGHVRHKRIVTQIGYAVQEWAAP
jgi:hypothetical protein